MSNRRMLFFIFCIVLAAMPITWLNVDPGAGDKLLKWTSPAPSANRSK